ncbi:histidine phosphatase family protein [Hahella sp. KA22]|uniref:histidine phosphatase family protein n=1 Tax=Hahella sp. KA22 TaxID=1628392 RepID=UPI000FDE8D4E|nr:histidine phosphatase family protein [Hahella sp. KA22]AZZ92441.1 histidine phosphatase family protein [Hahella sp. KA22]QAY55815.1 histidine phosphatase family protein [Hahella sp. KA22]
MDSMKVILARHGQTVWNQQGRLQGRLNSDLTDQGKAQADRLATEVKQYRFAKVYSSPAIRCMETCKVISPDFEINDLLQEQNFGSYEGLSLHDIDRRDPSARAIIRGEHPSAKACRNAESLLQVAHRANRFLDMVSSNHRHNETILVLTHGNFLKALIWWIHAQDQASASQYTHFNCAYSEITYSNNEWTVSFWGKASHLIGVL